MDAFLPRVLSAVLLLISIAMLIPIGSVAIDLANGAQVTATKWAVPLAILGTAAIMMWLLTRKAVPMQLYLTAFALWVLVAGYFFVLSR
jgi:hypothetical protein